MMNARLPETMAQIEEDKHLGLPAPVSVKSVIEERHLGQKRPHRQERGDPQPPAGLQTRNRDLRCRDGLVVVPKEQHRHLADRGVGALITGGAEVPPVAVHEPSAPPGATDVETNKVDVVPYGCTTCATSHTQHPERGYSGRVNVK